MFVVKGDSKFNTIEELIDFTKKNPNRLNMGTPGMNSVHHFALEIFKREAKVEINHIPFQGDAPGVVGVMGGHVDAAFLGLVAVAEHMKGGTMKGLAITSKRVSPFPNLPTLAEKGFKKTERYFCRGWRLCACGCSWGSIGKTLRRLSKSCFKS